MLNFGSGGGFLDVPVKTGLIRNFDASTAVGLYTDNGTTPVSSSGQAVYLWTDKASGYNATQATSTLRPVWTANLRNGLGGVAFDGVDDVMTAADTGMVTGTSDRTGFFVVEFRSITFSGSQFGGWSYGTTGTANQTWGMVISNNKKATVQGWVNDYESTYNISASTPFVYAAKNDTSTVYHFVNNVSKGTNAHGLNTVLQNLRIGAETNIAAWKPINAYQILFYNRALTSQEITDVQVYLMSKWGIS
jgi:hypothetical protein